MTSYQLFIQTLYHCITCADINECAENTDECDHVCLDNDGSYYCKCHNGYRLDDDGHGCEGIVTLCTLQLYALRVFYDITNFDLCRMY